MRINKTRMLNPKKSITSKGVLVSFLVSLFLLPINISTNACTTFFLRNGDHFVVGRNFDLSYGKYMVFVNRRNVTKTGLAYPGETIATPAIWTSKYGSVTFNMVGSDITMDGMNEAGLVVSVLILDGSVYPVGDNMPSLLVDQLLQYFLDNCASIDEVVQAASNLKIRNNPFINWELHYFVTDGSGNSAAIEFLDGEVTVTTGTNLEKKVLANSTYESSLEYFYNGREEGRPMTASLNRFYTAVEMIDGYNNQDIIDYSYAIMDAAEQDFTQRKMVYDITNRRIYFKSLENTNLRYFDMDNFDFSCQEQTLLYSEAIDDEGDMNGSFVNYTTELNQGAVQQGWNYIGVAYTPEQIAAFAQVPSSYECVYANAGENISICADNHQVSGNTATYYTGNWSVESGSAHFDNPLAVNTTVRNLGYGANRIRWTLNGDLGTFYDEIIITNNRVFVDAGDDVEICKDSYVLAGNQPASGVTGRWEIISGDGDIESVAAYNSQISDLALGINVVEWTLTKDECESSDEIAITNNSVEAFAGADQSVCEPEADLTATDPAPNTGAWTLISGNAQITDPDENATTATQMGIGENRFRWTVTGQSDCTAFDEVVITNNFIQASVGSDVAICEDNYVLTGNQPASGVTGRWEIISGDGDIESVTAYDSKISNLSSGTTIVEWTLTKAECESSDEIAITNNSVEAFAGGDESVCGTEADLAATDPAPNTGEWTLISGNAQIENPDEKTTIVSGLQLGENRFKWTVTGQGDCSATDVVVINNDLEEAFAGEDKEVTISSVYLSANEPIMGVGNWAVLEGGASFNNENQFDTQVNNLEKGVNKFIWKIVNNACSDSDTVEINYSFSNSVFSLDKTASINIYPNPFSELINIDLSLFSENDVQMKVINSKGQLVFSEVIDGMKEGKVHSVNLGYLPKGNYVILLSSEKKSSQMKVLKL